MHYSGCYGAKNPARASEIILGLRRRRRGFEQAEHTDDSGLVPGRELGLPINLPPGNPHIETLINQPLFSTTKRKKYFAKLIDNDTINCGAVKF
jgi:hypothetical protein